MRRGSLAFWFIPLAGAFAGAPGAGPRFDSTMGLSPVRAPTLRFTRLTAGSGFTCGLTADAVAWRWGSNQYGELRAPKSPVIAIRSTHWLMARAVGPA